MNFLDISTPTMMLVLVVGQLFSGALVFAYTSQHERSKALNTFLLSKFLQPVAWILVGARIYVPGMFIIVTANGLLFIGAALELIAFMMLRDGYTSRIRKIYLTLLGLGIIAFSAVTVFVFADEVRITVASFVLTVLIAFPIYRLMSDKQASDLQKMVALSFIITILLQLLRAVVAVTTDLDMSLESSSLVNTWMFVLLYLRMIAGSMGFILLDKEKLEMELIRAASVDGLTNSLNRQTFEKRAEEMISLFARKQEPVSCLLLDIDDFKKVNDKHSHAAGDAVLRGFAETIKGILRNYDLFGRYGGEEFAILLLGADKEQALEIAERLRAAAEGHRIESHPGILYTISIGVSTILPDSHTTTEHFYKLSDKALYLAKGRGKNQVAAG